MWAVGSVQPSSVDHMIAPPLTAERLLEGLSPKSDFRDGILGDLAEEFAERAESEGAAAAKRWYYREAVGVAPHLLYALVRSLRFHDVRRLAKVFFGSYFLVMVLITVLHAMIRGTLETLGIPVEFFARTPRGNYAAGDLALVAPIAFLYGFFAASLDKKTPLASAILFGMFWASLSSVLALIFSTGAPMWYLIGGTSLTLAGTTVGGMIQVRYTPFEAAADS